MQLAIVHTRAVLGIDAPPVTVETHLSGGLPSMSIVGLPETAVRESRDRVRSAIQTARLDWPVGRITINLAPADLPKYGGRYDLPIALGILAASGQLPTAALAGCEFIGELALTGALRAVSGALPTAMAAQRAGRTLVVPLANADEAALTPRACVLAAGSLLDVCAHLRGEARLPPHVAPPARQQETPLPDLADVRGQAQARRALEIAAAGAHALLLVGPPGTGKSMLAARLPGILPPLAAEEALETAALQSLRSSSGASGGSRRRPFRAPHHSLSAIALVGGGGQPRPGEISLAHNGVLFLDELPEFGRHVLDMLREPMESGRVAIARASAQVEFPARFQLVAAMNPCPCGWLGDPQRGCGYSCERAERYRARVSGPLLDRIDLQVEVPPVPATTLAQGTPGEASASVRTRVLAARAIQQARQGCANAQLAGPALAHATQLGDDDRRFLVEALARLQLSARATDRVLRVARTIADLAGNGDGPLPRAALLEALSLRALDRPAVARTVAAPPAG